MSSLDPCPTCGQASGLAAVVTSEAGTQPCVDECHRDAWMRLLSPLPCPYWSDGRHVYEADYLGEKLCLCGSRVKPR